MQIIIIKNKNIDNYKEWPIWECPISKFDWKYSEEEHCYIIDGKVIVRDSGNLITIVPGDYVIFPKGLRCHWEVIKPIKKHYIFK